MKLTDNLNALETYKIFSVSVEKDITNIDKYGNQSVVTISYKIKFIDIARFMASSLSNHVDNLTEGIQKIKCKDCSAKNNFIKYKCLSCNQDFSNKLDEKFKKRFK